MSSLASASSDPSADSAAAPAWECARRILAWMLTLFGEPAEIAGRGTIGPINRRLMRDWLASLERLVRRLLLLAALGLTLAPVRAVAGRMHARLARLSRRTIRPHGQPACVSSGRRAMPAGQPQRTSSAPTTRVRSTPGRSPSGSKPCAASSAVLTGASALSRERWRASAPAAQAPIPRPSRSGPG